MEATVESNTEEMEITTDATVLMEMEIVNTSEIMGKMHEIITTRDKN